MAPLKLANPAMMATRPTATAALRTAPWKQASLAQEAPPAIARPCPLAAMVKKKAWNLAMTGIPSAAMVVLRSVW